MSAYSRNNHRKNHRSSIEAIPTLNDYAKSRRERKQNNTKSAFIPDNLIVIREYDHVIFICTIILVIFGLVMVLSASSYSAMNSHFGMYHFFIRQAQGAALGFVGIIFTATINYKMLAKFTVLFYAVANAFLVAVLIFGDEIQGA